MYHIEPDEVQEYVRVPEIFCKGMSSHVLIFTADNGNHFTHYGIFEGMLLFFDLEKKRLNGHLSCYKNIHNDGKPPYKVSDKPLRGYRHIGRLVAAFRNYEE